MRLNLRKGRGVTRGQVACMVAQLRRLYRCQPRVNHLITKLFVEEKTNTEFLVNCFTKVMHAMMGHDGGVGVKTITV